MSDLEKFADLYELDAKNLRRWIIEAMVLGAVADGDIDKRESEEIIHFVASHAEFTGMEGEELRDALGKSFQGIVSDGFHVRMHAIAGALPRYVHRVFAFRAAVAIAFADGKLVDEEFGLLREMQKTFGIADVDVAKAFEDVQDDRDNLLPGDAEPVEAYLDCLLMAAAADGKLEEEELATIVAFVISRDEFEGIPEERIREYINISLRAYARGGIEGRLRTIVDELPSPANRETAYGLAAAMTVADGELAQSERAFLEQLQDALMLEEARASLVLQNIFDNSVPV